MSYVDIKQITDTFLKYTKINTTSVPTETKLPSCENQFKLAELVVSDFSGLDGVTTKILDNAITIITLEKNSDNFPSIVYFSHLDTAPDNDGDTKAVIVKDYDGKDIPLAGSGDSITVKEFPELLDYVGCDIITTDGTSLLGADDKAAIAAGVEAIKYMANNQTFKHGEMKLVLLPDEEIGIRGAKALDVESLKADFGICLDCCAVGEYVIENWYAGSALVEFKGHTAHPMAAKNKLVNSLVIANEFMNKLPPLERPEHTEGREGYYWCSTLSGSTDNATLSIAIRDFEIDSYNSRKSYLKEVTAKLQEKYGKDRITLTLTDTYSNVKEGLDKKPEILEYVKNAMKNLSIEPKPLVMRGGYDGSVITPNGLPTVNIFTGALNFHSTKEFIPTKSLKQASDTLIEIVKLSEKK